MPLTKAELEYLELVPKFLDETTDALIRINQTLESLTKAVNELNEMLLHK